MRFTGIILYGAGAVWCAAQLPATLKFVIPGALLGGYFHVVRGRPIIGLALCAVIVVLVPMLLWPSLGTSAFSDLTDGL